MKRLFDTPVIWRIPERMILLGGTFVFLLLYVYLYRTDVMPFNEYMGMTYQFQWNYLAFVCFGMVFVPLLWLPLDVTRPSQMVLWFLFLMAYLPVCTAPIITGQFDSYIILKTLFTVFFAFGLLCILLNIPRADLPRLKMSETRYSQMLVLVFLVLFLACVALLGIRLHIPTLSEIYGLREQISEQFNHFGRLSGYAVQWFGRAMTILLFVYGVTRKKPQLLVLAVIGQIYIFSLLAEKILFFSMFFVFLVLIMLRGIRNHFGVKLIYGSFGLLIVGKIQSVVFGSGLILFMTLRRVLVGPGLNTAYFFEYYSYYADKVYYANNIIGKIIPINEQYGYDYSPSYMVGMTYVTYAENFLVNLNVNLWGEGFGDFGLPGVFIATIILAGFLWLYDSVSRPLHVVTTTGILAAAAMGFADGSLYTQLMSNGLLFLLLMVYIMPIKEDDNYSLTEKEQP